MPQHGEEFIKEGGASAGGGGGGMSDLFDMLNGGGGRSRGPRGPRKSDDISQKLHVSLKDFYLGTTKCAPAAARALFAAGANAVSCLAVRSGK